MATTPVLQSKCVVRMFRVLGVYSSVGRVHVIVQKGFPVLDMLGEVYFSIGTLCRKEIHTSKWETTIHVHNIPISKNYTFILSYLLLRGECVEEELVLESTEETDSSTRGAVGRSHSS